MTYHEAQQAFQAARQAGDQVAAKAAWAAMQAAPDCPSGPKKAGRGSRAGRRQAAERRAMNHTRRC